jgi:hypothetical protein
MSKKLDECQLCGLPIGFLRCIPSGQLLPGTIHLFGTEYGEPRRSWNVRNVSSIIGELHGKYDYICWKGRQLGESTTLKVKPGNSRTVYFSTSHQRLLRKMQTATLIYIGGIGIIPVSKALILERFYILQQLWRHVWGLPPLPLLPRRVLGSSISPCRSCQGTYDIRWCSCTARNQSLPKIICIFHQESMVLADDNCLANAWTAQKIQYQFQKQDETRASLSQSWKSTHVPDPKSTSFKINYYSILWKYINNHKHKLPNFSKQNMALPKPVAICYHSTSWWFQPIPKHTCHLAGYRHVCFRDGKIKHTNQFIGLYNQSYQYLSIIYHLFGSPFIIPIHPVPGPVRYAS